MFHATKDLPLRHKAIIIFLIVVIVVGFLWWFVSIYHFVTVSQPTYGGQYTEAFVGQPRYINPLLSHSSSADRGLTSLIFNGLFDYDENGLLRADIAERFEVSEDGKEYTVFLRQDVIWHDGEVTTAEDVIFTINIAKDIAYGAAGVSNEMRLLWNNVRVEKIDDYTVKFILNDSNSAFLHNLTLGLIPKHIWENIGPEQFQLAEYNQKPIGAGAYEFVDLDIDETDDLISSYILRSNEKYYKGKAFITKFVINFYPTRAEAVGAYNNGEVSAVIVDKKEHIDALSEIAQKKSIELPHYFAIFFNQTKSVPLAFDEVREALSRATDRDVIVQEIFSDNAQSRYSPFADGVVGFNADEQQSSFDRDGANALLDEKGWEKGDDGIRSKGDARLSFTLHINSSQGALVRVAEILQNQWKEIGAELNIQEHDKGNLETNIIKPRDYDALLHAHQMRFEPNLLSLWHSKEKDDPGVNYALFDDKEMDESLTGLLATQNNDEKNELYKKQQQQLKGEVPAIFLFAPKLSFMYSDSIKDVQVNRANLSCDRYTNVQSWYIKEKRVK
ncbi:MAG: peptide ABC transporter substrate-binding protein, partial [Patescibacteria group bacterium]|nr:peptide ABC transporter substrate-binding protein [Patescibacteria group bacterium]